MSDRHICLALFSQHRADIGRIQLDDLDARPLQLMPHWHREQMNGGLGCTVDGEAGHGNEGEPRRDVDQRRFRALPELRQKCLRYQDQALGVGAASRRPLIMSRLPSLPNASARPLPMPDAPPLHADDSRLLRSTHFRPHLRPRGNHRRARLGPRDADERRMARNVGRSVHMILTRL